MLIVIMSSVIILIDVAPLNLSTLAEFFLAKMKNSLNFFDE
jgi:hypothetical protein